MCRHERAELVTSAPIAARVSILKKGDANAYYDASSANSLLDDWRHCPVQLLGDLIATR